MRKRINLLALMVIAAGGAIIAKPAPAGATYIDPWGDTNRSCCSAVDSFGRRIGECCNSGGCSITYGKCYSWE